MNILKITLLSVLGGLCFWAPNFAVASDDVNIYKHDHYDKEGVLVNVPYEVVADELSGDIHFSDYFDICKNPEATGYECKDFVPNSGAQVSLYCSGLESLSDSWGGWKVANSSFSCWTSLTVCSIADPKNCKVLGPDEAEGTFVTVATEADSGDPYFYSESRCSSGHLAGNLKDHCLWRGSDTSHTVPNVSSSGFTGYTGDDMFRIPNNTDGYLEYVKAGQVDEEYALRYIRRYGLGVPMDGSDVMIPAGPKHSYNDYIQFVDTAPSGFDTSKACYPFETKLACDTSAIILDSVPGVCGSADGESIDTYETVYDIPTDDLCAVGEFAYISDDDTSWTCKAINHDGVPVAEDATCSIQGCDASVLASGGELPASCEEDLLDIDTVVDWAFTDRGIIGEQATHNGSARSYTEADMPSDSPWSIEQDDEQTKTLRFSFDRDANTPQSMLDADNHEFKNHVQNSNTQKGTVKYVFTMPEDGQFIVRMTGEAEIQDTAYEYMNFKVSEAALHSGNYVASTPLLTATSSADGDSYDAVSPAYKISDKGTYNNGSVPSGAPVSSWGNYTVPVRMIKGAFPTTVALEGGKEYMVEVSVDSADQLYHIDAYYQFEFIIVATE